MISFKDDYSEGAHIKILQALSETNTIQQAGYGLDAYTLEAKKKIIEKLGGPADIHLISGGTQTNLLAISSFLRPHEACIAAETGHIAVHETGAIEHTGHKVITLDSPDGKINIDQIQSVLDSHPDEHMVKPKLVYISNPSEIGTVYSKEDLKALYTFTQENNLYLYVDGARLGTALATGLVTLKDMYDFTDAFFIGGTKNGALLGEALVIKRQVLKSDFRYLTKQKGALLAKGRLLGIQFSTLFTDDLFINLAKHAVDQAQRIQETLKGAGLNFLIDSPTNQIFPILSNQTIDKLHEKYAFYVWQPMDQDHSAVRLVTSWASDAEIVKQLIEDVKRYL